MVTYCKKGEIDLFLIIREKRPANDTTTSAYQFTESVVPTDQYKTDDPKERASDEGARNMVSHAMANWGSWAPRY